eukprot:725399-Amphidinium_carterae.1
MQEAVDQNLLFLEGVALHAMCTGIQISILGFLGREETNTRILVLQSAQCVGIFYIPPTWLGCQLPADCNIHSQPQHPPESSLCFK